MRTNKLSFIDSHDVGNMMIQLMKGSLPPHQEYNFACDETPTLLEFYQLIVKAWFKVGRMFGN